MNPVWCFKSEEWDENDTYIEYTIAGEPFKKLMDLCFELADTFSFGKAGWTYAKDRRLEHALQKFQVDQIYADHWFCYGISVPELKINLYQAADEAKDMILRYINHLFLWDDEKNFCTLEDLCFFKENELFFGTVTHERMCYAHILTKKFGERLKCLGDWEDGSDNDFAYLNLKSFGTL